MTNYNYTTYHQLIQSTFIGFKDGFYMEDEYRSIISAQRNTLADLYLKGEVDDDDEYYKLVDLIDYKETMI